MDNLQKLIDDANRTSQAYKAPTPSLLGNDVGAGLDQSIPGLTRDPAAMTDEELEALAAKGLATGPVAAELEMRRHVGNRNFVQNLTDPKSMAWAAGRMLKQAKAGVLNTVDVPAQLAGLYSLGSMGAEALANKLDPSTSHNFGSKVTAEFANDRYREATDMLGVSPPREVGESLAGLTGALVPLPTGQKVKGLWNVLEYVTPFVIGKGNLPARMAYNFGVSATMDQAAHVAFDGPDNPYENIAEELGLKMPDEVGALQLGLLAIAATAPVWGPGIIHTMATRRNSLNPTQIVPIQDVDRFGPDNLYTATTAQDMASGIVFDPKSVLTAKASELGVPDAGLVTKIIGQDTHAAGQVRVNEAMQSGTLRSHYGDFTTPTPPKQLEHAFNYLDPQGQKDYDLYLKLGNYADVIGRRVAAGKGLPTDAAELSSIQTTRATLRTKYPALADFSQATQQYTQSVRDFLNTGPYALFDSAFKQKLDTTQPHYVPINMDPVDPNANVLTRMKQADDANNATPGPSGVPSWLQERDITEIDMNTTRMQDPAVSSLLGYGHSALTAQLNNNARGTWIDQLLQSTPNQAGTPVIRRATDKEVAKYPDRVVTLVRNGKTEYYLTEKYMADLLKFDPYGMKGWEGWFNSSRRALETTVTGVLSPVFSVTTAIRDTVGGWINTPAGVKGPGMGTAFEPLRILGAKAMNAFASDVEAQLLSGNKAWQLPWLDEAAQKQVAARVSATYQNTLYHAAQEAGGWDASLLRDRIVNARSALSEAEADLAKRIPGGVKTIYNRSAGALFAGLREIIGAVSEAPRANITRRNVAAGMPIDEALKIAREITGDTMRVGRGRTSRGARVTGDIVNPEAGILLGPLSNVAEASRAGVPWLNPTLQGLRRRGQAAATAPVRTMMRGWAAVGLPTLAAYTWNLLLSKDNPDGYDYTDYDMNYRSSRDQVMEPVYFGIPGLPPERGFSLPASHEDIIFGAPYKTMLHHWSGSGEEMQEAMMNIGGAIIENAGGLAPPPMLGVSFALAGAHPPESITTPWRQTYDIREDNVGILNENVEQALRAQFGNVAEVGLRILASMSTGANIGDAASELGDYVASKTPILKNVGGWKVNSASFTPVGSEERATLEAWNEFNKYWQEFYGHPGLTGSLDDYKTTPYEFGDGDPKTSGEVPFAKIGPETLTPPTNPLYAIIGDQVQEAIRKKDYGFPATQDQLHALTDNLHLLRGFNKGRADMFKEWKGKLENADKDYAAATKALQEAEQARNALLADNGGPGMKSPEGIAATKARDKALLAQVTVQSFMETNDFIKKNKVDISNASDVRRLTNILEQERVDLMRYQLKIIKEIEDDITEQLQLQGLYPPGRRFSFRQDLRPMAQPIPATGSPDPQ